MVNDFSWFASDESWRMISVYGEPMPCGATADPHPGMQRNPPHFRPCSIALAQLQELPKLSVPVAYDTRRFFLLLGRGLGIL